MVETHWEDLRGRTLRYDDHGWELTGDVEVLEDGELLGVDARQLDDVRHESATLYFGTEHASDSLNPGDLGDHFDRLEHEGGRQYLAVKKEGRTYRYELHRLEYE